MTLQNVNSDNQQIEYENKNQPKEIIKLSLNMKKYGCFGTCPIYDLTIQSDGKVIFEGKKYTKTKEKAESKIDKEKIKQLIFEIEEANFFSFDNVYNYDSKNCPELVTDNPTIILTIKLNEKEKTINHDWGCWADSPIITDSNGKITTDSNGKTVKKENWSPAIFPQKLFNLENKIDEIVEAKRWVGEGK